MKSLNVGSSSLTLLLTIGVPSAVALLGLWWLLKRNRSNDDDGDESETADIGRSLHEKSLSKTTGTTTLPEECRGVTAKSEVNEKVVQDSGDALAQKRDAVKSKEICLGGILKADSQQLLMNQSSEIQKTVVTTTEEHATPEHISDFINASNSVSKSANPTGLNLQSDDCQVSQDCQGSPSAQEMVEKSSSEIPHEKVQSSLANSAANSNGSAVSSSDLSDQCESEVPDGFKTVVQTTEVIEQSVLGSSFANSSLQPYSSLSRLQSDSSESDHGSSQVLEKVTEDISTVACFPHTQLLEASSIRSDPVAAVVCSDSDNLMATKQDAPAVDTMASDMEISLNCVTPLQSSNTSCDNSDNTDTQVYEKFVLSESIKETGLICKSQATEEIVRKGCSKTGDSYKQEQSANSSQSSEPEQPALDTAEGRICPESHNIKEKGKHVCDVETRKSDKITSVQDIPPSSFDSVKSDFSDAGYCSVSVNNAVDIGTSVFSSMPQDAEGVDHNQPKIEAGASENLEVKSNKEEAKDLNMKKAESNAGTNKETVWESDVKPCTVLNSVKPSSDDLASSESTLKQESEESASSVILDPFSSNSNSPVKVGKTVTEATKTTAENSSSKLSNKKTVSKSLSEVSKEQKLKSDSPPFKSSQSRPKSSLSPPKSRQTSSKSASPSASAPPLNNSYSSRRNQSGTSDKTPECDSDRVCRTSSAVLENGRMDSGSPTCDTNSEASNDSGRGGSVGDVLIPLPTGDVVNYDFNFPSDLCGRLIGRKGRNVEFIKSQTGATVTLSSNPFTPEFQICRVQGMQVEVDRALTMIRKKFPISQFPSLDMCSLAPSPPAPVILPELMQMSLPEGISIHVVVSSIINAGHIFVQQPVHPSFPSLERLCHCMNICYGDPTVPSLPRPVETSIIVASESVGQWYRAQVVQVYPVEDECDIKYVDYGGYARVPISTLKQIRSDFMDLPFQAVECCLANITPLQDEDNFSDNAYEVLTELTSGQMLQGQLVMRGEDGIGYIHLYRVSGDSALFINRELVNREVVRWIEVL